MAFSRTRPIVRTLTRTASAIRVSVQSGPPADASACSSTRACTSLCAAALPREIMWPSASRSSSVSVTRYRFATAASRHATRQKIGPENLKARLTEH